MKKNWKIVALISLVLNVSGCPCRTGSDEEISQCLAKLPREDVSSDAQVRAFLEQHKVYVALTTSPKRISKIALVLQTLNLDFVEKVFVALPDKYRDTDAYVIPDSLRAHPKVEILQGGRDLGPIMKLLPAVRKVQKLGDPDAIVITVDDDTGYRADVIGLLTKSAALSSSVVGSKGINIDIWNIDPRLWPEKSIRAPSCYSGFDMSHCDMLEGFGCIAYPIRWVDADRLEALSQVSKSCRTSDDIVIAYGLAESRSPRLLINSIPFFDGTVQFAYGFEEDALHRGSGFLDSVAAGNTNAVRYQECVRSIHAWKRKSQG